MKIAVIAPGIRSLGNAQLSFLKKDSDTVILTNPLFQMGIKKEAERFGKVIHADDLLNEEYFEPINKNAKAIARNWFLNPKIPKSSRYRDINLGSLLVHPLTYYFIALLKVIHIYERLFECFKPNVLVLFDDGSYWETCGKFICEIRRVRFEKLGVRIRKRDRLKRRIERGRNFIKQLLYQFNQHFGKRPVPNGVIFSCSLKFAAPFLLQNKSEYYVREIFSLGAFKLSRAHSFFHLVVNRTLGSWKRVTDQLSTETIWKDLSLVAENGCLFSYKSYNLWPLIAPYFKTLLSSFFPKFMCWIDYFYKMIDTLKPRALVVDEDVAPFNKCLVQVCNLAGIPTYVLVHGAPVFDIGTIPLSATKALVWGASSKNRLTDWGIETNKILEVGAPQYSSLNQQVHPLSKEKVCKDLKIAPDQKLILLATQPFHTGDAPDFLGTPLTPDLIVNALLCSKEILHHTDGLTLIVKFHPGEKNKWFTFSITNQFPLEIRRRMRFIKNYDAIKLIAAADLVLTFGSTVYFEALLLNRPVVILDDPKKKFFEFMSQNRLDVKDATHCAKWVHNFFDGNRKEILVQNQAEELAFHFYDQNLRPIELISRYLYPNRHESNG